MDNLLRKEYVEVLEVLKYMEPKYIKKIPPKMIETFEKNKSTEYKIKINPKIPLKNQTLMQGTLEILALLNLKYWCEDEEEKKRLLKKYSENDIKYQNKYDIERILNEKKQEQQKKLVKKEKLSWYQKIINKIKKYVKENRPL